MYSLTVEQLCQVADGLIVGDLDLTTQIDNVVIDSRQASAGSLFVALQGSRSHGIEFAQQAGNQGAVVLVDGAQTDRCPVPCVAVPDAADALALLANHNRRQSEALVIAVTGSVGKTTTRRCVASVLSQTHNGIESPRNFNNLLGLPLSLLQLSPDSDYAVVELGASAVGEISVLSSIAQPDFGIVTSVSPAHLTGFGSMEGIQRAKSELIQALPDSGVAFLNADDQQVRRMADLTAAKTVLFGEAADADVRAEQVVVRNQQLCFEVDGNEYQVPVCGRHHLPAVLAAIAVGQEVGLSADDINSGLQHYVPETGRCQVRTIGNWSVIDDSYNASPASMLAALNVIDGWTSAHHRIAVLGDMLELGDQAVDYHFSIGARLAGSAVDHVLLIGNNAADVVEGFFSAGGHQNRISLFSDWQTLQAMLDCLISHGDVILIKGSRSTRMEQVLEWLHQQVDTADSLPQRIAA